MLQDQVIWNSIHWSERYFQYKSQLKSNNLILLIYLSVTLLTTVVTLKTTSRKIKPQPSDWLNFSAKQEEQEILTQQHIH